MNALAIVARATINQYLWRHKTERHITHGLHCAHCIWLFEYLLRSIWGAWGSRCCSAALTHMAPRLG